MASTEDYLRARCLELESKLGNADAEVRTLRSAAVTAAEVAERVCAKLETYEPVIKAARAFIADPAHVNRMFDLDEAVHNLEQAEAKEPRA